MADAKNFVDWMALKEELHELGRLRTISESEIWWCAMGENVGVEINGKGCDFARPVLILRKLNRMSFVGLPLTSQYHDGSWYARFRFKGREEYAVLAQIRVFSVKRLYRKMGEADDMDIRMIKERLRRFLFG